MVRERVALLIVDTASHLTELWRVAVLLRDSKRFSPVMYFTQPFPGIEVAAARCVEEEIGWEAPFPLPSTNAPLTEPALSAPQALSKPSRMMAMKMGLKRWIGSSSLGVPVLTHREERHLTRLRHEYTQILGSFKTSIVILAEDNIGSYSFLWVAAALKLGIRSVIVPFASATPSGAANAFFDHEDHSGRRMDNKVLTWFHPKWKLRFRGRTLVRLPAYQAFAIERVGLAPPNPWVLHSGFSDAVAVESQRMMQHYLDEGLPQNKLVLTGSLAEDDLVNAVRRSTVIRRELCLEHGLDPERRLVVCALPPSQFGALASEIEFNDYSDLLDAWTRVLADQHGASVVIRPHPRDVSELASFSHLLKGLPVSLIDTPDLIAACDIYVASVSATIRWAIAAAKPVLNYDVYRFGYDDYEDVPGVVTVRSLGDFSHVLRQMVVDDSFHADLVKTQAQHAPMWRIGDGLCRERLLRLIESLSNEAP